MAKAAKEKTLTVGDEIQKLQDEAGLTDTQLAARLEIHVNTLYRWKTGIVRNVRAIYLRRIREICRNGSR